MFLHEFVISLVKHLKKSHYQDFYLKMPEGFEVNFVLDPATKQPYIHHLRKACKYWPCFHLEDAAN